MRSSIAPFSTSSWADALIWDKNLKQVVVVVRGRAGGVGGRVGRVIHTCEGFCKGMNMLLAKHAPPLFSNNAPAVPLHKTTTTPHSTTHLSKPSMSVVRLFMLRPTTSLLLAPNQSQKRSSAHSTTPVVVIHTLTVLGSGSTLMRMTPMKMASLPMPQMRCTTRSAGKMVRSCMCRRDRYVWGTVVVVVVVVGGGEGGGKHQHQQQQQVSVCVWCKESPPNNSLWRLFKLVAGAHA